MNPGGPNGATQLQPRRILVGHPHVQPAAHPLTGEPSRQARFGGQRAHVAARLGGLLENAREFRQRRARAASAARSASRRSRCDAIAAGGGQ